MSSVNDFAWFTNPLDRQTSSTPLARFIDLQVRGIVSGDPVLLGRNRPCKIESRRIWGFVDHAKSKTVACKDWTTVQNRSLLTASSNGVADNRAKSNVIDAIAVGVVGEHGFWAYHAW